ncbi:MAG TPA: serine hydrolase, partial [Verrucomicrobiales bacterium]|nr:serine hydrolase [Verrucomicrobiales bacterium]
PDDTPADPSWQLKAMRIRDLITMTTGHRKEPRLFNAKSHWVRAFLHSEVEFKPGTHFQYNSAATYMLSAILQSVTEERIVDYLDKRLFQPLEIKKPDWDLSPEGVNTGGWGLRITTEDIAKLGQLYLQKGVWKGKRILSEVWVQEATSKQTSNGSDPDNDWDQGYGFQFWRCRNNCYRGDGAFGQFCIVIPEHEAVVAITSGTNDMGGVMEAVWDILLPSMRPDPIKPDTANIRSLAIKLKEMSLPAVEGNPRSPVSEELFQRIFKVSENEAGVNSVSFELHGDDHRITVEMDH